MRSSWAAIEAYAEHLRAHPDADVQAGGHCQGVARDIVGASGWAPSALDAALAIPEAHRHTLATALPGMIGYAAYRKNGHYQEYGHAFVLAENHYVYSTDLPVAHRLGKVPLTMITGSSGWNMPLLWFIDWTPSGPIAVKPPSTAMGLHEIKVGGRTPLSVLEVIRQSGMSQHRFYQHNKVPNVVKPGTRVNVPVACTAIYAGRDRG